MTAASIMEDLEWQQEHHLALAAPIVLESVAPQERQHEFYQCNV